MTRKMTDQQINIDGMVDVHNIEEGCVVYDEGNCYHDETPYHGRCPGIEQCPYKVNKSSQGPLA